VSLRQLEATFHFLKFNDVFLTSCAINSSRGQIFLHDENFDSGHYSREIERGEIALGGLHIAPPKSRCLLAASAIGCLKIGEFRFLGKNRIINILVAISHFFLG
jgi:hypothetical protein